MSKRWIGIRGTLWFEVRIRLGIQALALLLLGLSCQRKDAVSSQRALKEWTGHEAVLVQVANHHPVDVDEFEKACDFFLELTGIPIPADHSPEIELYPTAETGKALEPLRRWYAIHKDELYWDEGYKRVVLRPTD